MQTIPKVILLVESSRASGRALLCGIARYAHHHGPWSFYWEPGGLEKAWPVLRSVDAHGIILRDGDKVEEALACGLPAVVVGHKQSEIQGLVNVVTDSESVGRMGAEHLIGCGFKHFAYCGYAKASFESTAWSDIRRQAFSRTVVEWGFESPPQYALSMTAENWSRELQSLSRWLGQLPKPLGLMACNDDCAQRVMAACKAASLAVPDMVGVIGADNDEVVCGLTDPAISSIAINFERAGYEAAHALDRLMRRMDGIPPRITAVASHLVPRRSTDFVSAEEPHLTRALQHIRDHARHGLCVNQVAQAAGLSRRALEKRFRNLLGRSVLEEIRRVRTDLIARLLVETSMPVAEIADLLGFTDTQHIARYFRAGKGSSPSAYRRSYGRGAPLGHSQNGYSFPQTGVVAERAGRIITHQHYGLTASNRL
jgi:LacI family transcriptional regulator